MVASLRIGTFGGLSLRLDGNVLTFDAHSAEALLVYLACQRQPISREALAELFWPERRLHQARTNLRVALHRLRRQLASYLLITRQHVALQPRSALQVDCTDFENHLTAGRLQEAVALYNGDFLVDFYLDGSSAFEQWVLLERERLRTLAIAAFQQLISQLAATGQHESAIGCARCLLQLDAFHEPTHRQLMRLLAQAGQRSAALAQYEMCCQLLQRELDVAPDAATTALAEQIRTNDFRLTSLDFGLSLPTGDVDTPEAKLQKQKFVNLPLQPTPFIGREAELAQIETLLANPDCRLLSLLGAGGMGKTRLALAAATHQIDHFADGICFVPLAAVTAPEFLFAAVLESLHLPLGHDEPEQQVTNYLRERQLLLILDNFEHLLTMADAVARLLRHAPHLKVLITTRVRLQVVEEWLLPLAGLAISEDLLGGAAQLFVRSAQRVQPDFVAAGQIAAIAAICRHVEGMPLAIELAASWVRLMSCGEIALQLAHSFDLLSTTVRNLPERHRSMRALFEHSWRLLTPAEQVALRRLSVFQDGWTLAEAQLLLANTQDESDDKMNSQSSSLSILLALVDKSLVRSNGQGRFALHELVRQYAAEQLANSHELENMRQRHFAIYLVLARRADAKLRRAEAVAGFHELETEQGNLRSALQWALDQGYYEEVVWMGMALSFFWVRKFRWRECYAWLAPTLTQTQTLPLEVQLANLMNVHVYWLMGSTQEIERYADEIAKVAQRCNSNILRAHALFVTSLSRCDIDQRASMNAQAIRLLRQATSAERLPAEFCLYSDTSGFLAFLLSRHGGILCKTGDYAQATTYFRESLAIFRAIDDRNLIVHPLGHLGYLALKQGVLAQAQTLLQEAAENAQTVGDTMGIFSWQPLLALLKLYQGDWTEAWRLLQVCLVDTELQHTYLSSTAQAVAAMVKLAQGDFDQAAAFLQISMTHHYRYGKIPPELVDCLFTAARLATAQQQWVRSATLFGLAERFRLEIQHILDAPLRPWVEAALRTVQTALAVEDFADAFAAGQQLSLDEAFATILFR